MILNINRSKYVNFCPLVFIIRDKTVSKAQHHFLGMTSKTWGFRNCSEPWTRSVFECQIGMNLKKAKEFSSGEYEELVMKKFKKLMKRYRNCNKQNICQIRKIVEFVLFTFPFLLNN